MLTTIIALCLRITSNPAANAVQKALSKKHSATMINLYVFGFLSLFCIIPASLNNWSSYTLEYWNYVLLAGCLCTLGSICLIKALQYGEMSILGPINSYKCLVGLLFGYILLGEIPSIRGIIGTLLIIFGSWFIFDTVKTDGFFKILFRKDIFLRFCALFFTGSIRGIIGTLLIIFGSWFIFDTVKTDGFFKILFRKDIFLRFCALFFTGCEAVVLKKIILLSSPKESLILWCFSGFIFTLLLAILFKVKLKKISKKDTLLTLLIAICLGIMQYSTNIVFEKINVGLSLALFQLSGIISILFGYFIFKENQLRKKLLGTIIMIVGSCLILL